MRNGRYILAAALMTGLTGCSQPGLLKNSGQHPDAVLFERATGAVQEKEFSVANLMLQTLLDTYPDSKYADRAKRMLQDPRLARCTGGFSSAPPGICDPESAAVHPDQEQ